MNNLSEFLGFVAAAFHGTAYWIYIQQTRVGESKPNPASWAVWSFTAFFNALTYTALTSWEIGFQFLVGTAGCISTFLYALCFGKYTSMKGTEWRALVLGIISSIVWLYFKNAAWGNVLLLITYLISFKPTLKGVLQEPAREKPLPWIMWTCAFATTSVNVILHKGVGISLLMPAVLLIGHGLVAYLSRSKRKTAMRKTYWKELDYVQNAIRLVESENSYLRELAGRIHAKAIDRGLSFEASRDGGRLQAMKHNEALLANLRAREAALKERMGGELP